jgi:ATP-binding cassette subfamily B multidrug efflux pump
MFSRLFQYFETLVDPYTAYPDTDTPPRRLFAFMWDYSQPFKKVFAATMACPWWWRRSRSG